MLLLDFNSYIVPKSQSRGNKDQEDLSPMSSLKTAEFVGFSLNGAHKSEISKERSTLRHTFCGAGCFPLNEATLPARAVFVVFCLP